MTESKQQSFNEIIRSGEVVLVDFHADWCGPCKMMQPVLKDLRSRLGDEGRIIKIDVDKNPQAAQALQIKGVPTLIIFKDGMIKWRQSGVVDAAKLEEKMRSFA